MTKDDKNKRMARLFGIEWHEILSQIVPGGVVYICTCHKSVSMMRDEVENHCKKENPDFTSDPGKVRLLREMEKHPQGKLFFATLLYDGDYIEPNDDDGCITRDYITDTTGKLMDACLEFMEERE